MRFAVDALEPHRVIVRLRDGNVETTVAGWRPEIAAAELVAALEGAERDGYADCYWPEPTGQYWWMLKREDNRLEVVVMWSAGAVPGWQHVFRAADEMGHVRDEVRRELRSVGLGED